jgi:exopolysaccharide production protein ExoQ
MIDQAIEAGRRSTSSLAPALGVVGRLVYPASVFFLLHTLDTLGFLDLLINGPSWYGKTGGAFTHGIYLLAVLTGVYLFWCGTYKPTQFKRALPVAVASILLISAAWSADPRTAVSQGVLYITTVLGAIGLAQLWDGDALLELTAKICAFCAFASLLVLPPPGADFQGIFPHKNILGAAMSVGVLACLHTMRVRRGSQVRNVLLLGVCTTVAIMSKSTTSFMVVLVLFVLNVIGQLYLRGGRTRTVSLWLVLLCFGTVIFFLVNEAMLFELLGKDPTLTGRTTFWPYVIDNIFNRPFLGWGYFGFWTPFNPIALQIAEAIKGDDNWYVWIIPNAHNGLLEILLEIGFVGTFLFGFLLLRNFMIAVKCLNGPAEQLGLSLLMLLVGILLDGVSEIVLLVAQQVWPVVFFTLGFLCEKQLRLARHRKVMRSPGAEQSAFAKRRGMHVYRSSWRK